MGWNSQGQRCSLRNIERGELVVQYGHAFGISRGIAAGVRSSSEHAEDIGAETGVCAWFLLEYLAGIQRSFGEELRRYVDVVEIPIKDLGSRHA